MPPQRHGSMTSTRHDTVRTGASKTELKTSHGPVSMRCLDKAWRSWDRTSCLHPI